MRLVLLGPPGVGKGTEASIISKKFNVPHISTGDILRNAVRQHTDLGMEAKQYMNDGKLVPDDIIIGIMCERIAKEDCQGGFILDGSPRTLVQAEALGDALNKMNIKLNSVINLQASEDIVIERLSGRRVCKSCGDLYHIKNVPPKVKGVCDKCEGELYQRSDDEEKTIRNRLKVYESQMKSLIDYYSGKGLLKNVDSSGGAEATFDLICEVLKEEKLI